MEISKPSPEKDSISSEWIHFLQQKCQHSISAMSESVNHRKRIFRYKYDNGFEIKNVGMQEKACAKNSTNCKDIEKAMAAQWDTITQGLGFSIEIQDCMYINVC